MPKSPITLILLGRSGSGKGTQAILLEKHFRHLRYISTGDLFRALLKNEKHVTAKRVKQIVNGGGLPPHWLASYLWTREIIERVKPHEGVIFDGAPRRLPEARLLDEILAWYGRVGIPLFIDISRKEAFDRLSKRRICKKCAKIIPYVEKFKKLTVCDRCGGELRTRRDDDPKSIWRRLQWFDESVMPVIRYYKKAKRLKVINGEQSIEDVCKDILKVLK